MEGDRVAWLHVERQDPVLRPLGVEVGHELEAAVGVGVGDVVDEAPRHEPTPPAVRAGDELDPGRRRHRVQGHPEADALVAVDAVVGLVVVPGGDLPGPRLLHEHVLVEEAGRGRAHQPAGDAGQPRLEGDRPELGDAVPAAVVTEELPGPALGRVLLRPLARLGQVALDAGLEEGQPLRVQEARQEDGAIPGEGLDGGGGDLHGFTVPVPDCALMCARARPARTLVERFPGVGTDGWARFDGPAGTQMVGHRHRGHGHLLGQRRQRVRRRLLRRVGRVRGGPGHRPGHGRHAPRCTGREHLVRAEHDDDDPGLHQVPALGTGSPATGSCARSSTTTPTSRRGGWPPRTAAPRWSSRRSIPGPAGCRPSPCSSCSTSGCAGSPSPARPTCSAPCPTSRPSPAPSTRPAPGSSSTRSRSPSTAPSTWPPSVATRSSPPPTSGTGRTRRPCTSSPSCCGACARTS